MPLSSISLSSLVIFTRFVDKMKNTKYLQAIKKIDIIVIITVALSHLGNLSLYNTSNTETQTV